MMMRFRTKLANNYNNFGDAFCICIATALFVAVFDEAQAEALLNPSFEISNHGQLATFWSIQNFGSVSSTFFRESRPDFVRDGDSAQKIVFKKVASTNGSLQFHQLVSLSKGKLYRFSFWIRTDPGNTVKIRSHVRHKNKGDFGGRYFNVTQDYQKVDFLVATNEKNVTNAKCGIQVYDDSVLYIDNANLEEVTNENGFSFDSMQLPEKIIPPEFFGIEYRKLGLHKNVFKDINQGLVRIWGKGVGWAHIQPNDADVWNFKHIDSQLDYINTYIPGAKVLIKLGMAPSWSTGIFNDPDVAWSGDEYRGANHMVMDTADWINFVEKVVSRYDGKNGHKEIHYYEIWNEANHKKFWKGGMENLLTLAKLAYKKIKDINPNAKVLLPNFTTNAHLSIDKYLSLLSQTGEVYADLADIHIYYADMMPELTINNALVFKEHLERWGFNLPVWNSEGSAKWKSTDPLPSPAVARGAVARGYILNWVYGLENFTWYSWGPAGAGYGLSLVDSDWKTLTPAGEAYKQVAEWLTGFRITDSLIDKDGNYIVIIDKPMDFYRGYIVWRTNGSTYFKPDPSWNISQWVSLTGQKSKFTGNSVPVSIEPILFEAERNARKNTYIH